MSRKIQTTNNCLCFMLQFAQCFGMLPVCGISDGDCASLKFKWTAKRTLYSMTFLSLAVLNTFFQALKMARLKTAIVFGQCVTLLFFSVTIVTVAIFIDVARKWPNLMRKWAEVDDAMKSYGFPVGLHKKLKTVTVVVMTAAIAEHSLFLAFMFKHCQRGDTFQETVQLYFEHSFDQVFNVVPYNIVFGLIIQIFNLFSTVSWNFMDLFIMLISLSLSFRFKQVVTQINILVKTKETNENMWRLVREDYTRLSALCETVDDAISTIILVSFANNIYVVLVQLYFSLQRPHSDGILDKIYYVYSFSFLIIRTVLVALYAATIHSESKKPQYSLNNLSPTVYNIEIERFIHQTKYDTIALTGHRLFKVTKSLILSVASAIVFYELVLIQFNIE